MDLKLPPLKWYWKDFEQLTALELYQLLKLRQDVFVLEQTCLYPDIDGEDVNHKHLLSYDQNNLVGYLRVIPPEFHQSGNLAIGRVVTSDSYRGLGVGRLLMEKAIEYCLEQYPKQDIVVSAQHHLEHFYQSLNFNTTSEVYLEDGIPHVAMTLSAVDV